MSELLLLLLIAFLVVGPKDLPKIAKGIGKGVKLLGNLKNEVSSILEVEEEESAVKQECNEIKEFTEELSKEGKKFVHEMGGLKREVVAEIKSDLKSEGGLL